ncbi:MAG: trypsin-like peptidase domain-containing protein [Byssovorax sp.]
MSAAPTSFSRLRSGADVVAAARRSVVGVRGVSSGGTGWVALGNGLVLTSQEAVGYQSEVFLDIEGQKRVPGAVIWVDVARDLALIRPADALGLPPLFVRPDLPRLGELVFSLGFAPGESMRVGSALVSAVDRAIGAVRAFDLDAPICASGSPVVDADGRVIGIGGLDLPRGAARSTSPPERGATAVPVNALQRVLGTFDRPADKLADLKPTYRCAGCNEPFAFEHDRCLACGRRLPHAFELGDAGAARSASLPERTPTFAAAERLVRDLLSRLGAVANSVRTGPRTWKLQIPGTDDEAALTEVTLTLDPQGRLLRARYPLVQVPPHNHERFYRFLLTLNDQSTGSLRISIEDDIAYLGFAEPTALVKHIEAAELFEELVRAGERYRGALRAPFQAPAAS